MSDDLSFHFADDAPSAQVSFIAAGYACGS